MPHPASSSHPHISSTLPLGETTHALSCV